MELKTLFDWFCKGCLIFILLIIINSVLGDMMFRLRYSFPKVKATSTEIIDTSKDPLQINLEDAKYIKARGEKNIYALKPVAEYSIAGLVITKNTNFWFRDIMRNTFDDICLMDIGIVWGDLAKDTKELHRHWKFKSHKTLGQSRRLEWRSKPPHKSPWTPGYVSSHISHTHLIPANNNVMGGLLSIKKNDIVKLDGYLVDIYTDKSRLVARSSMSRTDTDPTSRGSGACEDMYVKQVQVGNKIYK